MGIPVVLRTQIYKRSGGRCERCGKQVAHDGWQAHHRKPRRMGGRAKNRHVNTVANLVVLCVECHRTVELNRMAALGDGFILHETETPEEIPMFLMGRRPVLLGESYTPVDRAVDDSLGE